MGFLLKSRTNLISDLSNYMKGKEQTITNLEKLERKDVQQKVQGCINSLDDEFKEVLILRDIQGFSYEEISSMLKIPEGTVKSRLFRARDALKDCLKKVMGDL
jgi:RNA polymerase sigma-70 factor (ECF subfamily)